MINKTIIEYGFRIIIMKNYGDRGECYLKITRAHLGVGPGRPCTPFCPGIFFFCKQVLDGTSSFVT